MSPSHFQFSPLVLQVGVLLQVLNRRAQRRLIRLVNLTHVVMVTVSLGGVNQLLGGLCTVEVEQITETLALVLCLFLSVHRLFV